MVRSKTSEEESHLYDQREIEVDKTENVGHSSAFQSFWNIVKTFAGAGSFGLPWAFYQSGIVAGALGMILFALLSNYTMKLLVRCRREIQNDWEEDEDHNESAYRGRAVNSDNKPLDIITYICVGKAAMGRFGEGLMYVLLLSCNLGVCTVYLVLFGILMNSMVPELDVRLWFLVTIPLFVPMSWIRSYKYLAPTSILGTISLLLGMGTVIYFSFERRLQALHWPWQDQYFWIRFETLPLFIGVNSFLFNTHSMVLPIEQTMKNRRQYSTTLNLSFAFVASVNLLFGVMVYLFFGPGIKDNATANLPKGSIFVILVKSFLCLELLLTYAVVLMPVSEIIDSKIFTKLKESGSKKFYLTSNVMRSILVLLTIGVAEIFGPQFGMIMDFIGGLSPNAMGFITPSLFYLILCRKRMSLWAIIGNICIITFGVVCMFVSTGVVIYRVATGQE